MLLEKSNRSLSPHLHRYKAQVTSVMSIFHRITGSVLAIILLCTPICFTLLYSFVSFNLIYFLYSILYIAVKTIFYILSMTFCFHLMNGIRHILWDFCIGLDISNIFITGCLVSSMVLALTYIFILL